MKNLFLLLSLFFFINCRNEMENKVVSKKIKFNLEKIIVLNEQESCVTFFKVLVTNDTNENYLFQDNNLLVLRKKGNETFVTKAFYLMYNEKVVALGAENYGFFGFGAKKRDYVFLAGVVSDACKLDSISFKKNILNSRLIYNGKNFNIDSIIKDKDFLLSFRELKKNRNKYVEYKDSLSLVLDKNIQIKYIDQLPHSRTEWDNL